MDKIIPSFKESLFNGAKNTIKEFGEFGIDSILNEGLFKEFPIASLLIGVKNASQNIHDRNLLKQTIEFIREFNSGTLEIKKYRNIKKK